MLQTTDPDLSDKLAYERVESGQRVGVLLGRDGALQLRQDLQREPGQRLVDEETEEVPSRPHEDAREGGVIVLLREHFPISSYDETFGYSTVYIRGD